MLKEGVRLIAFITRARTPMPKSTGIYFSDFAIQDTVTLK
jgi:hypothetical protein